MKKIFFCLLIILTCSILPEPAHNAAFDGEIVRLHVIANSDSEADQRLKLKVRDAVLNAAGTEISEAKSIEGLNSAVRSRTDILLSAAEQVIRREGYNYNVDIEFGIFPFPAKTYGNVTFPAGDYNAVRVVIGSGEGKNWWCVLFPPLCFTDETYMPSESLDMLSSDTTAALENKKFKVKFKIAEVFKK